MYIENVVETVLHEQCVLSKQSVLCKQRDGM